MRKTTLPVLATLMLLAVPASLTACKNSETNKTEPVIEHSEISENAKTTGENEIKEYDTVDEQIQAWKDNGTLKPTNDPNIWKATKPLPRPSAALKIQKPQYPQAGYEHTQAGAEAVAIYLQPLIAYAFTTGDYEYLRETCSETSDMCNKMIAAIQKNEANNEWLANYTETNVKILGVGIPDGVENPGEISFRISSNTSDYIGYTASTMPLETVPPELLITRVSFSFIKGKWIVVAGNLEQ